MNRWVFQVTASLAVVIAFAATPALAAASPVLTSSGGTVTAGTKIVATNTGNIKWTTSQGTLECTKGVFTGTVKTNTGNEIEWNIESASFTGTGTEERCTTSFGGNIKWTMKKFPWCSKAWFKFAADTFELKSGACGGTLGAMELTTDSSTVGECTYTKNAITGTFTTGKGGDTTVSEQEFVKSAGSGFCPSSLKFDWTLDLYLDPDEGTERAVWFY